MKKSKLLLVIGVFYSWIMATMMIILSLLAIMAYSCQLPIMKSDPLAYLLYLTYFRSRHCEAKIHFDYLGLSPNQTLVDAEIPRQTGVVTRTFTIASLYMVFNVSLSLFAVACLFAMRLRQSGKVFKATFGGVVLASIAVLVLDFAAMGLFIVDCLQARTAEGLMNLLEIRNQDAVRSMFEAIPLERRVMPSIIMVFASSKGILLLIVNVILMSIIISTNWIDRKERARIQNFAKQAKASNLQGTTNTAFTPD